MTTVDSSWTLNRTISIYYLHFNCPHAVTQNNGLDVTAFYPNDGGVCSFTALDWGGSFFFCYFSNRGLYYQ